MVFQETLDLIGPAFWFSAGKALGQIDTVFYSSVILECQIGGVMKIVPNDISERKTCRFYLDRFC